MKVLTQANELLKSKTFVLVYPGKNDGYAGMQIVTDGEDAEALKECAARVRDTTDWIKALSEVYSFIVGRLNRAQASFDDPHWAGDKAKLREQMDKLKGLGVKALTAEGLHDVQTQESSARAVAQEMRPLSFEPQSILRYEGKAARMAPPPPLRWRRSIS